MSMTTAAALTRAPRVCHPLARPQASPDMTCTSYGTLGLIWSEGGEREREREGEQRGRKEKSHGRHILRQDWISSSGMETQILAQHGKSGRKWGHLIC